jgi:lipid II:glycine glycyltransferase (peptidoglycan interpeptide bridge formation enzyme)
LNTLAVTSAAAPGVSTREITSRAHWDRLFAAVTAPCFPQAWAYGEGKRARGWSIERLAFESGEGTIAICQVLVRRVLGLPVVARINRGPMFLSRSPSEELQLAVFRALRQRWRFGRRGLLLIAPALPASDASTVLMRGSGFFQRRPGGWGSALIDLSPSLDAIRAALSSKWRNHLNAALKTGMQVRVRRDPPAWDWMLERHAHNMKSKGFVGPEVDFVRHMIAASPEDFRVFEALIDSEPVCGILVARFGDHAETFLSWTSDAGRRSNAHHRLLWEVLSEMKAAGCVALDLGGYTTNEKYGAYKRGMKGREYRLSGEWLAF